MTLYRAPKACTCPDADVVLRAACAALVPMSTYTPEPSAKTSTAIVPMAPPAKVLVREPTEAEIAAIVVSKGFAMMLIASYKKEVATSIASKLRTREGKLLYQSAAFSLPLFACSAAEAICPASLLQAGTKA